MVAVGQELWSSWSWSVVGFGLDLELDFVEVAVVGVEVVGMLVPLVQVEVEVLIEAGAAFGTHPLIEVATLKVVEAHTQPRILVAA